MVIYMQAYTEILLSEMLLLIIFYLYNKKALFKPLAYSYPGHSILTEDLGKILGVDNCPCGRLGKYFSISGRIKHSELRGCSDVQH